MDYKEGQADDEEGVEYDGAGSVPEQFEKTEPTLVKARNIEGQTTVVIKALLKKCRGLRAGEVPDDERQKAKAKTEEKK